MFVQRWKEEQEGVAKYKGKSRVYSKGMKLTTTMMILLGVNYHIGGKSSTGGKTSMCRKGPKVLVFD